MHTLTRITVTLAATQPLAWPHYAGSTLRGAFGRALRKAACITGQAQCTGCPLRQSCAYGVVFDPAAPAQPIHPSFRDGLPLYLVQPPALGACQLPSGQQQSFDLLLMPGTEAHQSLIHHTLHSAVEKELFATGMFKLMDTQTNQVAVLPTAAEAPAQGQPNHPARQTNTDQITLRWLTPLRLQHQSKPVFKPQQLDAPGLVRALLRRQMQWQQITGQRPETQTPPLAPPDTRPGTPAELTPQPTMDAAHACTLDTRQLQWHDLHRHSGTQKQKLPLGGLIGSATLTGPTHALTALQPLLQMGEQLHIGKETVMGLGRYQIDTNDRQRLNFS